MNKKVILMFACIILVLVSCSKINSSVNDENGSVRNVEGTENINSLTTDDKYSWSTQNAIAENINTCFGIQSMGDGAYFIKDRLAYYYDCELDLSTVLCTQQGCDHSDSTCSSWVGGAEYFGVYNNEWYFLDKTEEGGIKFEKIDPSTNKRSELYSQDADEKYQYDISEIYFSHNKAYFLITYITEENSIALTDFSKLIQVDLETGNITSTEFMDCTSASFVGGTDKDFYVMLKTLDKKNLKSYEEFYEENGPQDESYEGDAYRIYFADYCEDGENLSNELRKYTLDGKDYSVICDLNVRGSELGKMCYGDIFCYKVSDEESGNKQLWLYDMITEEKKLLVECKGVAEYLLADGKIFYNRYVAENAQYEFHYVDIETGEDTQLDNKGIKEYWVWLINGETSDHFIGNMTMDKPECLSKQDFYDEKYENSIVIK